jgi:hypothetical protein
MKKPENLCVEAVEGSQASDSSFGRQFPNFPCLEQLF